MQEPIYWPSFFFLLFSALACAFAIAVVVTPNVVRMAFYLVLSLASTAGLFFLAGADFVGAMQLMIYVGGTLVLLVFGVMLTAQGPFVSMKTRGGDWILAALLGGSLLAFLIPAAFSVRDWTNSRETDEAEHHAAAGDRSVATKFRLTAASETESAEKADVDVATGVGDWHHADHEVASVTPIQKDTAARL